MNEVRITRESLLNDDVREWAQRYRGLVRVLSLEELQARLEAILAAAPTRGDTWVFAYGSLLWNPAFHYIEERAGTVYGYHREFCLRTNIGRGSPELPGLLLGLDRGGSCRSVALRIPRHAVRTELGIIFRREMLTGVYEPRWVNVHISAKRILRAVTFVIDPAHERYASGLSEEELVSTIASAVGPLGKCCDYLFETVDHLRERGLADRRMEHLAQRVREHQAR